MDPMTPRFYSHIIVMKQQNLVTLMYVIRSLTVL
jgi:hypothetical protein